jgi:hypothetical protein
VTRAARTRRAYFRAMRRMLTTRSNERFLQLWRLAECLANRIAKRGQLSLFAEEVLR